MHWYIDRVSACHIFGKGDDPSSTSAVLWSTAATCEGVAVACERLGSRYMGETTWVNTLVAWNLHSWWLEREKIWSDFRFFLSGNVVLQCSFWNLGKTGNTEMLLPNGHQFFFVTLTLFVHPHPGSFTQCGSWNSGDSGLLWPSWGVLALT